MGFKKNNPACNCCGNVLVWDMGQRERFLTETVASTTTLDWTWIRQVLVGDPDAVEDEDQRGAGAEGVDFVLIDRDSSDDELDAFDADDVWGPYEYTGGGCLELADPAAVFDPETDAVDLGYWTGDIYDYSLIIWHTPYSDDNITEQYSDGLGGDCGDDTIGCQASQHYPDSGNVWGGLPAWWEEVAEGRWQGRVVIVYDGAPNAIGDSAGAVEQNFTQFPTDVFAGTSTMSAMFLNELSDVTEIEFDVSTRRTTGLDGSCVSTVDTGPLVDQLISTDCELVASDIPYVEPAPGYSAGDIDSDLLDGVSRLYGTKFYHNISGGEELMGGTAYFRDFCTENEVDVVFVGGGNNFEYTFTVPEVSAEHQIVMARSLLVKVFGENQIRKVEFVFVFSGAMQTPSGDDDAGGYIEDHKRFLRNLFRKKLPDPD